MHKPTAAPSRACCRRLRFFGPCAFMVTVTVWSLADRVLGARFATVVRVIAGVLFVRAVSVTVEVLWALRRGATPAAATTQK